METVLGDSSASRQQAGGWLTGPGSTETLRPPEISRSSILIFLIFLKFSLLFLDFGIRTLEFLKEFKGNGPQGLLGLQAAGWLTGPGSTETLQPPEISRSSILIFLIFLIFLKFSLVFLDFWIRRRDFLKEFNGNGPRGLLGLQAAGWRLADWPRLHRDTSTS